MEQISKAEIETLKKKIEDTVANLDLDSKRSKVSELETKSVETDFWKDQENAKSTLAQLTQLKDEIKEADDLLSGIGAIYELYDEYPDEEENPLVPDFNDLKERFEKFEILKFLNGKYDKGDAILSVHSGQGGTEANDWAEMLLRMYTRYAERMGWSHALINYVGGGETGLSTATLKISGVFAFGKLKRESGTHRLIRLSPFNAQNLRQTSFAGVEVVPIVPDTDEDIVIRDEDIDFKAVRASGAGGQHVNKTSSAVQITHIPTGITVHCSERRDQSQNKKAAMEILKAKLWQIEDQKREDELADIKGEHKIAGWGNQIRNYILHPYKLVKDLRTEVESFQPEEVLDGDLTLFIDAEVRLK